jgi:hypothetical protein
MFYDTLRPPPPYDPEAAAYKDWLHLNLLDHASGSVGLINVSLHGAPGDPRSRAVGTALVHVPGRGWVGNLEIRELGEAAIGRASIGLEQVALAVDHPSGTLMASVRDPDNQLVLRVTAEMAAVPLVIEERLPLGHGWISWYAVPRLTVTGEWTVGQEQRDLRAICGYHDHSWGRWFWGDDLGWEWACFLTPATPAPPAPAPDDNAAGAAPVAVVFALTTDRTHRHIGQPSLTVYASKRRRTFRGHSIKLAYDGTLDAIERRVPGALAALHQDHVRVRLPKRLTVHANDGIDRVTLEFTGRSAAQLIMGEPIVRGYSFIHEIAGEFTCVGRLGDVEVTAAGLGVFEYVC